MPAYRAPEIPALPILQLLRNLIQKHDATRLHGDLRLELDRASQLYGEALKPGCHQRSEASIPLINGSQFILSDLPALLWNI